MAGKFKIGAGLALDGEKEFKQAVSGINKDISVLASEMSKVTAQFDGNSKSMSALTAKSGVYNKQIDTQKQKIETLKAALANSTKEYGEADKKTKDWQISLNKAEAELSKMDKALAETNKQIEAQNNKWTTLGKSMEDIGKKMETVGKKMTDIGKSMSMSITAPIVAGMAVATKLASDLNESLNKVEVAFGDNADEIKAWADTTLKSFGISRGTALDMASAYGDMATSMGLSTNMASNMSARLVGLAGDLASFKNISIDVANTALTAIFTGETESLKKLGVVMTQANLQEYALSLGIKTRIADMTQAEQVQLRYVYVLSKTTNAQGDFIRTGEGTANSARVLKESLKELGETIGQNILPVITPIIQKLTEMIQAFGKLSPGVQKAVLAIAGIVAVIGPALVIIGTLISSIGAIVGVFGTLSTAIAGAGGIAAVFGAAIAALTGPVGLVIAAIAAGIAIGVLLYKNWDKLKAAAKEMGESISNAFQDVTKKIGDWMNSVKERFNEFINYWFDLGVNLVNGLWNGIKSAASWLWDKISEFFKGIVDGIKNILGIASPSKIFAGIGENMALGLGSGFESSMRSVAKQINASVPKSIDVNGSYNVTGSNNANGSNNSGTQTSQINITVPVNIGGRELRKETYTYYQQQQSINGVNLIEGLT